MEYVMNGELFEYIVSNKRYNPWAIAGWMRERHAKSSNSSLQASNTYINSILFTGT